MIKHQDIKHPDFVKIEQQLESIQYPYITVSKDTFKEILKWLDAYIDTCIRLNQSNVDYQDTKGRPTIESFKKIEDLRMYLLHHKNIPMIASSCRWYLDHDKCNVPEPEDDASLKKIEIILIVMAVLLAVLTTITLIT